MSLRLTSPAFAHEHDIPSRYTCEGGDVSPPLAWTDPPAETKSFALVVDDPDAPDPRAPKRTWVHWVLFNVAPVARALVEDAARDAPPRGATEGKNDWGTIGWRGPCPPIGKHRYFFKLYALDRTLDAAVIETKQDLELAMKGHTLATATLIGSYRKSGGGAS